MAPATLRTSSIGSLRQRFEGASLGGLPPGVPKEGRVAEREGFEPSIPLRVCRISSAVLSTAQPPLRRASCPGKRLGSASEGAIPTHPVPLAQGLPEALRPSGAQLAWAGGWALVAGWALALRRGACWGATS